MRKALCSVLVIAALATSGCTVFRGRSAPNEFEVARNAPLIIPPEYNLTPPVAGTAGISAGDAQQHERLGFRERRLDQARLADARLADELDDRPVAGQRCAEACPASDMTVLHVSELPPERR